MYVSGNKPPFKIERSGSPLFGVITYGSHMTAYQPATESSPMKIWVAKRSAHKTYGGMLDNSVAGGIGSGITPLECMIKEAGEEASLSTYGILVTSAARLGVCCSVQEFVHISESCSPWGLIGLCSLSIAESESRNGRSRRGAVTE